MELTKTSSGNWAKEITITAGGKWRFVGNFATLERAEAAASVHREKGRKVSLTEETTSRSQAKKQAERVFVRAVHAAVAEGLRGKEAIEARAKEVAEVAPKEGQTFYRVEAYIARQCRVMTHATAAECVAFGGSPGKMNI